MFTRERFHYAWLEHLLDPSYQMPEIPKLMFPIQNYQKYDTFTPQDFQFFEWWGRAMEKEVVVQRFEEALQSEENMKKLAECRRNIKIYDDSHFKMFARSE